MCGDVHGCVRVCAGVRWCAQAFMGVYRCVKVCTSVHGYVWDEFSEYLLETRVLTSADCNTYPIQIFYIQIRLCHACHIYIFL